VSSNDDAVSGELALQSIFKRSTGYSAKVWPDRRMVCVSISILVSHRF
jgi:hypothetical protein